MMVRCGCSVMLFCAAARAGGHLQYRPLELTFSAQRVRADPFDAETAPLTVVFRHEAGRALCVRGFWDGGATWRVRFQPELAGRWDWESFSDLPEDAGLHGRIGLLRVEPPGADAPEQQRHGGILRVSTDRTHLTYADGTPFFWLADTWWAVPQSSAPVEHFARLIALRRGQGFTLAQLHGHRSLEAEGRPDVFQLMEAGGQAALEHWRKADAYYRHAEEQGWHLCVGFFSYESERKYSRAAHRRLWSHFLARYGAYPITFLLTQEYNQPYELGRDAAGRLLFDPSRSHGPFFVELGRWVHACDPYRRAMTAHSAVRSRERFDAWSEPWYAFALLQNGHFTRLSPSYYREVIAREPARPVIEGEANYEGFQRTQPTAFNVDAAAIRASAYGALQSGCAGYSYGAQGLYGHVTDAKKAGASARWGPVLTWEQGAALEGAGHLAHLAALYRSLAWWRLRPLPKAVDASDAILAKADGADTCLIYFPAAGAPVAASRQSSLADWGEQEAAYGAEWFDPRTGVRAAAVAPVRRAGALLLPLRPDGRDWILLLQRARSGERRTPD